MAAGDLSGNDVGGAGDVNGDGLADLIIGSNSSERYVVFGNAAGFGASFDPTTLDGTNGFRLKGGLTDQAGAGDINGDGIDDLILGAYDSNYVHASYVVFGSRDGFDSSVSLASLTGATGFRLNGTWPLSLGRGSGGRQRRRN